MLEELFPSSLNSSECTCDACRRERALGLADKLAQESDVWDIEVILANAQRVYSWVVGGDGEADKAPPEQAFSPGPNSPFPPKPTRVDQFGKEIE